MLPGQARPRPALELIADFLREGDGASPDWSELQATARQEGLLGILARRSDCREAADFASEEFHRQAILYSELARIDATLASHGLDAILLKGFSLLSSYGGRLGLRPVGDIDLLARPGQKGAVAEALGLARDGSVMTSAGTKLEIDLAEDLVGATRIPARAWAFHFDLDQVWGTAQPLGAGLSEQERRALKVLERHHQFLHLSVHALKHGYSRLVWVLDLALVLPTLEEADLVELAERSGTARAAAVAVALVSRMTGEASVLSARLPPLNRWERACVDRVLAGTFPPELGEALTLFSLHHFRERLAFLGQALLLSPRLLRAEQSGPLWRIYLDRLRRLRRILRSLGPL